LPQAVATRTGGFGGAGGLAAWLSANRIDALIDATHPFAAQISANAVKAVRDARIRLGSLVRPPWSRQPGDIWIDAPSPHDAARALGETPRRVLLTAGRLELSAFAAAPQHTYIARTIDPPGDILLPPRITFIRDRGPFQIDDEVGLIERESIELLVTKNSGGPATYAKIEAARRLGVPVVMIARPAKPLGDILDGTAAALLWLETLHAAHDGPRSARGV
jgi:precorrin-6A/cobalt-precorrin-6A reductase